MPERGPGARYLVGARLAHDLQCRLGEAQQMDGLRGSGPHDPGLLPGGDSKSAIGAVPTKLVEDVALIGP